MGCGRIVSRARPRLGGMWRLSRIRRVRRPSSTGWSCPVRHRGGDAGGTRTCWLGHCQRRAAGAGRWPGPRTSHLAEALDAVARKLGGLTRRWRFDRMAAVCHPGSGTITAEFAGLAKYYQVGVDVCPPRHGNRKGVVEKANHSAAQRWWRTLPDDTAWDAAQQGVDTLAVRMDTQRRVHDGQRVSVGELAAAEPLRPVPAAPYPAELAVIRTVTAQTLVAFRGNSYSVPP